MGVVAPHMVIHLTPAQYGLPTAPRDVLAALTAIHTNSWIQDWRPINTRRPQLKSESTWNVLWMAGVQPRE